MDEASHFQFSNPSRTQPLAADNALKPQAGGYGRVCNLAFTTSLGTTIPVTAGGKQTFEGSGVPVQAGGSAGDPNGDPQVWDVAVTPMVMQLGPATSVTTPIYWQLRWWIKGAAFESPIVLVDDTYGGLPSESQPPTGSVRSNGRVVIASSVEVAFWATTNQPLPVPSLAYAVSMVPFSGGSLGAERLNWQWSRITQSGGFTTGLVIAEDALTNPFLQGGYIGQSRLILGANPGAVKLYPMAFDAGAIASVTGGVFPVNGSRMPPVLNVGDFSAQGDEFRPATRWGRGLIWGLSTTPDVWTAPSSGTWAAIETKVGT